MYKTARRFIIHMNKLAIQFLHQHRRSNTSSSIDAVEYNFEFLRSNLLQQLRIACLQNTFDVSLMCRRIDRTLSALARRHMRRSLCIKPVLDFLRPVNIERQPVRPDQLDPVPFKRIVRRRHHRPASRPKFPNHKTRPWRRYHTNINYIATHRHQSRRHRRPYRRTAHPTVPPQNHRLILIHKHATEEHAKFHRIGYLQIYPHYSTNSRHADNQ